jgi:phage baseplate assembly protein V
MSDGLLDFVNDVFTTDDQRIYGVMLGTVKDNLDMTGLGRVQVTLPAVTGLEPWARVAAPFAGSDYGHYSLPQTGDEVVVAFERGDPRHPVVIGSLWSMDAQPPADLPTDATDKRIVKTPKGHVIELDDLQQTITITTSTGQEVKLATGEIEISAGSGAAKATLTTAGSISLQATTELKLSAPKITVSADGELSLSGAMAKLSASGVCEIQGSVVKVN